MPPNNAPGRLALQTLLNELQQRLTALETQQGFVITDPKGIEGDPANNHATVVAGPLKPITGLSGSGIASYKTGAWVRVA